MELALKAVAKVVHVDLNESTKIIRRQPLFDEEIHIEEELINLEEAIKSYHLAQPTLKKYPSMHRHQLRERRLIMIHCIGLAARMLKKQQLPREYDEKDTNFAIYKLVNLVVADAHKAGYQIDHFLFEIMKPHLSLRLKFLTGSFSLKPANYLSLAWQKLN